LIPSASENNHLKSDTFDSLMSPVNHQVEQTSDGQSDNSLASLTDSNRKNLKDAVRLPDREDPNEWIANNLFDFHKQICMLFGTISEFCNAQSCPKMTAGKKYEYWWSKGPDRRPVESCASDYIDHLLDWVQEQLDDEEVFPSLSVDKKFPKNFNIVCQTIARRLFRVYAHICHHHLNTVKNLKEEAHMNTSLKHFIYFIKEFDLVPENELEPLKDYIENLTSTESLETA